MQMVALGGQEGEGRNFPPALIYSPAHVGQNQPELGQAVLAGINRQQDLAAGSYDFEVSFPRSLEERRAKFAGMALCPSPPPPVQQGVQVLSLGRFAEHGPGGVNRSAQVTRVIQQGPAAAVSPEQFLQLERMGQGSPASGSGEGLLYLVVTRPA